MILPRLLSFDLKGAWSPPCDLRGVQGTVAAVGILTRPTLGPPRRALFPGGDGETHCSKVHSNHPSKLARSFLKRDAFSVSRAWPEKRGVRLAEPRRKTGTDQGTTVQ